MTASGPCLPASSHLLLSTNKVRQGGFVCTIEPGSNAIDYGINIPITTIIYTTLISSINVDIIQIHVVVQHNVTNLFHSSEV